jgi:hypothetical protein
VSGFAAAFRRLKRPAVKKNVEPAAAAQTLDKGAVFRL